MVVRVFPGALVDDRALRVLLTDTDLEEEDFFTAGFLTGVALLDRAVLAGAVELLVVLVLGAGFLTVLAAALEEEDFSRTAFLVGVAFAERAVGVTGLYIFFTPAPVSLFELGAPAFFFAFLKRVLAAQDSATLRVAAAFEGLPRFFGVAGGESCSLCSSFFEMVKLASG